MTEIFTVAEARLLPSNVLVAMKRKYTLELQDCLAKQAAVQQQLNSIRGVVGMNLGRTAGYVTAPSLATVNSSQSLLEKILELIASTNGAMASLISQGQQIYTNFSNPSSKTMSSLSSKIGAETVNQNPNSALNEAAKKNSIETLTLQLANIKNDCNSKQANINMINDILARRAAGKEVEPIINYAALAPSDSLGADPQYLEMINKVIIAPFESDKRKFIDLLAQLAPTEDEDPTFDLVYGPPIAQKGQFVLSEDGLYYDSRGVDEVPSPSGDISSRKQTHFEFAPNLGGRGVVYEEKDLDIFVDTVLDLDLIDDSFAIQNFYDSDNVLQQFKEDRKKQLYDTSGQIQELLASGFSESGAVISNHNLTLGATLANYDIRIKKRKKQLELAMLSNRFKIEGDQIIYHNPETKKEEVIKSIPINDFSFLRGTNLIPPLDFQAVLTLSRGDVQDNVLPIKPIFLNSIPQAAGQMFNHLALAKQGHGPGPQWIGGNSQISTFDVSGTGKLTRNITDSVISDGLDTGFSFLSPDVLPDNNRDSNLDNFAHNGTFADAKLVANSTLDVFPSGLSIPFFSGTNMETGGSYVEIPARDSLFNMFYLKDGFTISFWVYLPPLAGGTNFESSHKFRICMANENSGDGGQTNSTNAVTANAVDKDKKVRGLVLGFRDNGSDRPGFCLYPTVSQNDRNGTWGHSVCFGEDASRNMLGLTWDDASLSAVSSGYYNFVVQGDSEKDDITLYMDGAAVTTSSMKAVFGSNPATIPTFITDFQDYNLSSYNPAVDVDGTYDGVRLAYNASFTTFILGGGFTDSIPTYGFMGRNLSTYYYLTSTVQDSAAGVAGAKSGLHGHLGLPLFYTRALNTTEIKRNYDLTKTFFKNIKTR